MKNSYGFIFILGTLFFFSHSAFAQVNIPEAAEPSRVGLVPSKKIESPSFSASPSEAHDNYDELVIDGASDFNLKLDSLKIQKFPAVADTSFIDQAFYKYRGQNISLQKVIDIINGINRDLHEQGYILNKLILPPQDTSGGQLILVYIEGRIDKVVLNFDDDSTLVRDAVNKMKSMSPLNIHEFERIMLLLNDLSDAKFSSVFSRANDENLGEINVTLEKRGHADSLYLLLDNASSRYNGPLMSSLSYRTAGFLTSYDDLMVKLSTAVPIRELKNMTVGYGVPAMGLSGLRFSADASVALTQAGDGLSELDLKGKTKQVSFGASYPLIRSRGQTLILNQSFDLVNARTKILGDEVSDDRLRVFRTGINYQWVDEFFSPSSSNTYLEFSQGVDILGSRESGSDNLSRADGRSDFNKISFQASRLQHAGSTLNIFASLQGQYAFSPLLSFEEFGFGGLYFGRGYDPSEFTADSGIGGTLEARYMGIPTRRSLSLEPYTFLDFAKFYPKDEADSDNFSALSAGLGIRFYYGENLGGTLFMATPVTLGAGNPPGYTNPEGPRYVFSFSKKF